MKILVTGGAGFLGSHLCERLVKEGHDVTCLDDFSTGSPQNIVDIEDLSLITQNVRETIEGEYDQIYNLACPASPVAYQRNPIMTLMTSVEGIWNVLHLANLEGSRVLQASTSEVYGDPTVSPQRESYWGNVNPIGIRACYDEGKRAAETLCFDFERKYGTEVRVARIFNTYGPRMAIDDGRVVSNFIVQALRGEPITIYGDGYQSRSFCYVDDLIEGLIRLMNYDQSIGPVNIGNPMEFSMLELAEMVMEVTGSFSPIVFKDLPQDDPKQRRPEISKARTALDWRPRIELLEGLEKTAAYFREVLK
jgi:UDP-glucuronate decarboxylase